MKKKTLLLDEDKKRQHGFKNVFRMLKFYKKEWIRLAIYTFLVILISLIGIAYPIIEKNFLTGVFNRDWNMFLKFFIIYAIITVVDILINCIKNVFQTKSERNIWFTMRNHIMTRIFPLSQKKLDNENTGKIYSRVTNDVNELTSIYIEFVESAGNIISNCGKVFVLFMYSWQISIYIVLTQLTLFLFDNYIRSVRLRYRRAGKRIGDYNSGVYHEALAGLKDIKCLNMENEVNNKIKAGIEEYKKVHIERVSRLNVLTGLRSSLWGVFYIGFGVLSFFFLKNGQIKPEIFSILYMYFGSSARLFRSIQSALQTIDDKALSAERVLELYDDNLYPQDKFGDKVLGEVAGHIEVKDVTFGYSEHKILFEHLSLDFAPYKVTAIVGKSGEGKSSIANLLFHLYDWQDGSITIDGTDIRELTKESFRSAMSIIPQNPYIFNTTIRENLAFAKPNASQDEMWEVLEKAQLADYIRELEQGLDTIVGENGIQMSGGQKQRLSIARALLKDSPIMVFDEATSALDNYAQGKIQDCIETMRKNHTVIIIAHRLSTIKDADKIIVLGDHTVVDEGTHDELMKRCDIYQSLYAKESVDENLE